MNTDNLRMTRQRKLILEELRALTTHPTADEVYELVRKRLPRVSLGTVYRNLETLAEAGAISKLPGTPMRFDGELRDHHHIRCIHCPRVDDLPTKAEIVLEDDVRELTGWEVVRHQVEFLGVCPNCKIKHNTRKETPHISKGGGEWQV